MLRFLARRCIPDFQNTADPKVRQSYGILCGAVGILFNTLLCIAKLLVGILSGSIAITADALNNLSDAGSSAITLFGFRLAAQKPDTEHPFGHGRFEYIAGLIVSLIILLMGVELGKSSVEKILHPAPVAFHHLVANIPQRTDAAEEGIFFVGNVSDLIFQIARFSSTPSLCRAFKKRLLGILHAETGVDI